MVTIKEINNHDVTQAFLLLYFSKLLVGKCSWASRGSYLEYNTDMFPLAESSLTGHCSVPVH